MHHSLSISLQMSTWIVSNSGPIIYYKIQSLDHMSTFPSYKWDLGTPGDIGSALEESDRLFSKVLVLICAPTGNI